MRPIFKGDEAKLDSKKSLPFQRDQMGKICEVLGPVKCGSMTISTDQPFYSDYKSADQWPGIVHMPEYKTYISSGPSVHPRNHFAALSIADFSPRLLFRTGIIHARRPPRDTTCFTNYSSGIRPNGSRRERRYPTHGSRKKEESQPSNCFTWSMYAHELIGRRSVFEGSTIVYPSRRVTHEDNGDVKMGSYVFFRVNVNGDGCL